MARKESSTRKSSSSSSRKSSSSKNSSGGKSSSANPLVTLIVLIVVAIAGYFGINLTGNSSTTPTNVPATSVPATSVAGGGGSGSSVQALAVGQGFGAQKGFWQVYFTAPTGSSDRTTYRGGIDENLAAAIGGTRQTLDIAAFEWNSPALTAAVVDAARRGVRVRMVVDDEHTMEDSDTTIQQVIDAGANVVDDGRSALMHNKFMILDGSVVWTGSWNYTINDTYRNNNNAIAIRSRQVVGAYQAEFDEMFANGQFGPRSPRSTSNSFTQDGTLIQVYFSAEDEVTAALNAVITGAQRSIRFMAFSFTLDDVAQNILARSRAGVTVQGIFETTGSETEHAELRPLFCAGLNARQDGNRYVLHHKVFIIDDHIVVAGSFNFSAGAADSNDENLFIIDDADLAAQYIAEFDRRFAEARRPEGLGCN